MITATEAAASLREIADWLEAHPGYEVYAANAVQLSNVTTREQMVQLARDFGRSTKDYSSSTFYLERDFGKVSVWAGIPREQVCTAQVIGKRTVPAVAEPEHEEDVIEWICTEPLLKPAEVA